MQSIFQWYLVTLSTMSLLVSSSAGALNRPERSAPTGNGINTSSLPYIEVLRGSDGRDGRDGVPGPRGSQGQRGERGQKGEQGVAGPPVQGMEGRST